MFPGSDVQGAISRTAPIGFAIMRWRVRSSHPAPVKGQLRGYFGSELCHPNRLRAMSQTRTCGGFAHRIGDVDVGAERRSGCGEAGVESGPEFVGRQLHPLALLTPLIRNRAGGAEHGDHTGDSENLGPPHERVR